MTPEELLERAVIPALRELGGVMDTPGAAVFLVAWCLQESGPALTAREQILPRRKKDDPTGPPPALGLPQLEFGKKAMTALVVAKTPEFREWLIANGHDPDNPESIRQAARDDDVLALMIARIGAYYSSKPMPAVGDAKAAWALYYDAARPGKPKPEKWAANYARAVQAWKARGLKPLRKSRTMAASSAGSGLSIAGLVMAGLAKAQEQNIDPMWMIGGCGVLLVLFIGIKLFRLDDRLKGLV